MIGRMEPLSISFNDWEMLSAHLAKFSRYECATIPPLVTINLNAPVEIDGKSFEAGVYHHPGRH
jgi:hypothetical protein